MTKLLILDNDDQLNWSFQEMFARGGFDTHGTCSDQEALRLLGSGEEFDVVLIDNYLPDLHVGEFLERIARMPIQPRIVVMHRYSANRKELHHYHSLGVRAVVDKSDPIKVRAAVSGCCADEPMVVVN